MHPEHLKSINKGYEPRAIECVEAQLDTALRSFENTRGPAATYWAQRIHELVGRIYLSELGGSILYAKKLLKKSRTFNFEFRDRTYNYLTGKISLDQYKDWLYPVTFLYLKLSNDHPANDVKHVLAELSSEYSGLTEEQAKSAIRKIMSSRLQDLS